jgi:zinc D-Ala-D-Ala carboxypeptidase
MKLSEHFSLEEMLRSESAIRHDIPNVPENDEIIINLKLLCENSLEPLRAMIGKSIHVLSGYRNLEVNKLVGGAKTSQHLKGQAVDFVIPGMNLKSLFEFTKRNIIFDQLIYEFDSWIHISYSNKGNRKQSLIATKEKNKTVYKSV